MGRQSFKSFHQSVSQFSRMATIMPRAYRSATEYRFDEEQTDAIIRTTAYHRRDFNHCAIWFSGRERIDFCWSIGTSFQRTAKVGPGHLDRLPLELLCEILPRLDMYSLFKLRQVNLRLRQAVDSLKQYQRVITHALNILGALLRTRLAVNVSLFDFDNALCTKTCLYCGEFGGFMLLPTWKRCCIECLQRSLNTQLRSRVSVQKRVPLTKLELTQMRSFESLSGLRTMLETAPKSHITSVPARSISSAYPMQPNALAQAQLTRFGLIQMHNATGSCALPYYDKETGEVERGISCVGCQRAIERELFGTRGTRQGYDARDKVYARDGFLDHFRWCKQAQLLWKSSGEGK
ncbi:F-box protein [Aspergillus ibericus CBS 121593]|uniref:F-box domain-containing protein n=1 Tax=Aspergillus ibericus CBS 121593 TaxID=1448316 RepID=A0A395GRU7_9EURO|nr:hypothetical protein BO80DRAFT_496067 [Aspergillus ibericus CBS 121593]RAK97688.1 hypothetical protein BO80DRAFT_496067 [Aspergillus ibericus CBS 121593]